MIIVSDTSAITALLQIHRIEVLPQLYAGVIIPHEVAIELRRYHPTLPAFIQVLRVTDADRFRRLRAELDLGEAAAITLMLEGKGDLLLIDERRGRSIARREGLAIIGVVGVLLEARVRGLVPSLREVLHDLESTAGFRVAAEIKIRALQVSGETDAP
ncbi:MAG: DUF3368 domain-containing protein [Verrucomicrobia bacterium]|nr:DUF3368 domain-containing protein [Verrucomicrobiota bacterium]